MRTRSHLRCLPKNHLRYPKNTIYVYGACHALAPLGESGRSYGAPGHFLVFKLRTERTYGACHEFPFAAGIRSVRSELCVESPDQEGIKLRQERPVDGYHHQSILTNNVRHIVRRTISRNQYTLL